eukprot:TRINITY_DN98628_c0_g1_i1.p1 TRINITY_DN98628_c0_g1~~TRINITY_DN98628_c0_g1_i1.p1  ORF type:complete len:287 (-),score=59.30 TRINITY_DN98628_c0_g1_i1:85-879(-)
MAVGVLVPQVLPHSTVFCPSWPQPVVRAAAQLAEAKARMCEENVLRGRVTGHTTPSVSDIGAASVRLRLSSQEASVPLLPEGGYLLAVRIGREHQFLPVVAGVPGNKGLDRHGCSREGLAECCVIARPVTDGTSTFLPDGVLQAWAPVDADMEVIVLARLTDFFLGLNAGTWLRIRIQELMTGGKAWIEQHAATVGEEKPSEDLLAGTGLVTSAEVSAGIEDSNELFQYWGGSGNAGVSGQVILLAPGTEEFAAKPGVASSSAL